jgi:Protein of unknown function (DUF1761)
MLTLSHFMPLAAALSCFLLGGLWYSPLAFLKPWAKAAGMDMNSAGGADKKHPAQVFGFSFLFALVSAYAFAAVLGHDAGVAEGLRLGLLAGGGLVAASFGINYQFANKPWVLWLIDGGYHLVQFALYGLILGAWY